VREESQFMGTCSDNWKGEVARDMATALIGMDKPNGAFDGAYGDVCPWGPERDCEKWEK
jgi:hypothetical protein